MFRRMFRKSLRILVEVISIPTAPTIHLPDGWTVIQFTRGQKGADKDNDPVLCFFSAARVTTGFEILSEIYRQAISTRARLHVI